MRILKFLITEIPHYLLVGKGLTYDIEADISKVSGPNAYQQSLLWAIESVAYHNGPIDVLIAFGILGMISTLMMFAWLISRHLPRARGAWRDVRLQRCHQAALAVLLMEITFFFTVYGDAHQSYADLLFYWGILEALLVADRHTVETLADAAEAGHEAEESTYAGAA